MNFPIGDDIMGALASVGVGNAVGVGNDSKKEKGSKILAERILSCKLLSHCESQYPHPWVCRTLSVPQNEPKRWKGTSSSAYFKYVHVDSHVRILITLDHKCKILLLEFSKFPF
jgi:hypothetical protein